MSAIDDLFAKYFADEEDEEETPGAEQENLTEGLAARAAALKKGKPSGTA